MFTIRLKGLKVFAYHGVNPEETRDGQYFYFDVTAETLSSARDLEDNLEHTVSYAAMNKLVLKIAAETTYRLIESLAVRLCDEILAAFSPVFKVTVTVNKPHAPMRGEFENVSVTFEECREMSHEVYLSLGSNLGKRDANLTRAIELLRAHPCVEIAGVSSLYSTEPMGYLGQGMFLNCCVKLLTSLSPVQLLGLTQGIEQRMKRVKTILNGPRVIDLDILLFDEEKVSEKNLVIPHPRMMERRFVLKPLLELYDSSVEKKEEFEAACERLTEYAEIWNENTV